MNEITVSCSDGCMDAIVAALNKLTTVSSKSFCRNIRIGGTDVIFDARSAGEGIDVKVGSVDIADYIDANPTPDAVLGIADTTPAPVAYTPPTVTDDDDDEDDADDGVTQTVQSDGDADEDEEVIRDSTKSAVLGGQMFTAYDITSEAKESGQVQARHNVLKHIIHDMYCNGEMDGYEQTLVPIRGTSRTAYLYHPSGTSPDDYVQVRDAVTG